MDARDLVSPLADRWRLGTPAWLTRVALPAGYLALAVVTLVVSFPAGTGPWTVADFSGWAPLVISCQLGVVLAALVLGIWQPRWGAWVGAGSAAWLFADGPSAPAPVWWAVAAACWSLAGFADLVQGARQRAVARDGAVVVVPTVDDATRRALLRPRLVGTIVLVGSLLVALGFSLLYVHDARAVDAFRSTAVTGTGTVTKVDVDDVWFDIDINGRTVRASVGILPVAVGDELQVAYAPDGSRGERTDDVFDPTGPFVFIVPALLVALAAAGVELGRRRSAQRLLRDGGVAWRVAVAPSSQERLDVAPLDATSRVLAQLRLSQVAGVEDVDDEYVHELDEDDEDGPPPVSALSDEDLLDWMRAVHAEDDDQALVEHDGEALVVGLERIGDWPVVLVDGGWWMSGRAARQPWSEGTRPTADRAEAVPDPQRPDARRDRGARPTLNRWSRFWDSAATHLFRRVRRSPLALPFLAAPAVGLATAWLFMPPDGASWYGALIVTFAAASTGAGWVDRARPRLRASRAGLRFAGTFVDRTVPWSAVQGAVADDDGLVVRLDDDAIALRHVAGLSAPLLPGDPTPHAAAELIASADRAPAPVGQTLPSRARRTVSPAALAGALWAASVVVGAVVVNL